MGAVEGEERWVSRPPSGQGKSESESLTLFVLPYFPCEWERENRKEREEVEREKTKEILDVENYKKRKKR